jgi:N-acetylmuramoyl-L-alanine amidase
MMRRALGCLLVVVLVAACVVAGARQDPDLVSLSSGTPDPAAEPARPSDRAPVVSRSSERLPLAGRTVVLDPGHQLGNHRFPRRINRRVPAGGFRKPCNTTGTATRGGFAEATFAWRVSLLLRSRLERLGAEVVLTRHSNRQDRWGPCVDERGRAGNKADADLLLSVHGDGSDARGARGFHVIAPTDRRPWTHDIHRPSKRLARGARAALRAAGFRVANYTAGGDGLDLRSDLGTLNLSDVPAVMVELGNMRHPRDARTMTSHGGRAAYAKALARAVRGFLR